MMTKEYGRRPDAAGPDTAMPGTISPIATPLDVPPRHRHGRSRVGLRRLGRALAVALTALATVASITAVVAPDVTAQTSDDAARQAAREIQAARDRANAAADAFFRAQSDLEVLEDEAIGMQRRADAIEQRVEKLRRDVQALAVARFASSGAKGIPLLTGMQAPKDQVQAAVLVDVVTNAGNSSLDEFEAAQEELRGQRDELARQRRAIEDQQQLFSQLQADAEAEVTRLREIEEQRLTDEAVRRALAEQQAAIAAELEETELRTAEAAARALPNPGIAAAQAAEVEAAGDGDPDATEGELPDAAPRSSGASGGTSGGRTGTGGAGSVPIGVVNGAVYIDAIVCPMNGSAYGDTWGAPRSGGRSHEGVDMLAPTGTPVYAVVSGVVNFRQNRLGGNAASLAGDNGNRYYFAHLASYEGASRRVTQGEVIGYNGETGNATGTPHLHFEIHPGGGLPVNPTPSVRVAGC
jgi:peptidoglycan LD-endopeptidase LytH